MECAPDVILPRARGAQAREQQRAAQRRPTHHAAGQLEQEPWIGPRESKAGTFPDAMDSRQCVS